MPKFAQMNEGKYLKKEDAPGPGLLLTISEFAQENVALQGEPEEKKWIAYFHETEKGMVLNSTNLQLMQLATQVESSEEAIGKQIVVFVDPTIAMAGRIVGGLRIRAPRRKAAPAPVPAPQPPPAASAAPMPHTLREPYAPENGGDDVPF